MKTSMLALFLALVLIAGGVAWHFLKEKPKTSCADNEPWPTIIAFGDSLVAGYGAITPGGFVSMVASSTGARIVNLGKEGDTTADAKQRVPQVLSHKPDIVLVLLGGNDALRKVPVETTRANLETIITELQQGSADVILLGVLGGVPWSDPYRDMFADLAKAHDVAFVPNVLSGVIGHADFMSDSVHPNDQGYAKIAARVAPALQKACDQLSR